MKTILKPIACAVVFAVTTTLYAQTPSSLSLQLTSTGRSTGHIANLNVTNTSDEPTTVTFPCAAIPSDGKHQEFVAMEFSIVDVPPGGSGFVEVNGYCLDVDLPAPLAGTALPTPIEWSNLPNLPKDPFGKDIKDVKPVTDKPTGGVDKPLGAEGAAIGEDVYRPSNRPSTDTFVHEPAHIPQEPKPRPTTSPRPPIAKTVQSIIDATETLQGNGSILTPFSGDRENEHEILVQHVIWIAASPDENPYTLQDICADVREQYETFTGTPFEAMTPDEQSQLQTPINQLLDAVNKVGTEAGVDAFLPAQIPPSEEPTPRLPDSNKPEIMSTVKATGTGRTTGHIADLTVSNPTTEPIVVHVGHGNAFIPSTGQYQPYIVPAIAPIPVAPGETKTVPIEGFCTDIHLPPVPAGGGMPSPIDWFSVPVSEKLSLPSGDLLIPTFVTKPVTVVAGIVGSSGSKASGKNEPYIIGCQLVVPMRSTIPGTDYPIPPSFGPNVPLDVQAPILLDALNKIATAYDEMQAKGVINTPFSGDPEKEREAVIQQTLWMYNSMLGEKKHTKNDFKENTIKQFEQNTGADFESLPPQQQEKVIVGVDDFWNTFEAVGVAAKVLTAPLPLPMIPSTGVQDFFDTYDAGTPKILAATNTPQTPGTLSGDQVNQASVESKCTCGPITFKIKNFNTVEIFEIKSTNDTLEVLNIQRDWKGNAAGTSGELAIFDVSVSCPCSPSGNCYFYPRNSDFKEADEGKATIKSTTHKKNAHVDSWFTPDNFIGETMKFTIHAWCKGDDCAVNKNCMESFSITLVEKKK